MLDIPKLIQVGEHDFALIDEDLYDSFSEHKWWNAQRYAVRSRKQSENIGKGAISMHCLVALPPDGYVVDHKNGNTLDNRRSNLRVVSQRVNCVNSLNKKSGRSNLGESNEVVRTSKYTGVSWRPDRKRWTAYIGVTVPPERDRLGCFSTELEAALAYNAAATFRWGKFAILNDIECTPDQLQNEISRLERTGRLLKSKELMLAGKLSEFHP